MRRLLATLAAGLLMVLPANGQDDDKKKDVTFETTDEVRLTGKFYRGLKNGDSPAVLIVHGFKSDRSKGGWESLASMLQEKGFAVLTFDLRGHGGSTMVRDKFWNYEQNKNGIRGGTATRTKGTISVNDFKSSYWPVLLNDIAAARHFLDIQNDAQKCNTGSLIVIVLQEGASLAIAWMCEEWQRKIVPAGTAVYSVGTTVRNPGEDIACGILLVPVERSAAVGTSFKLREWVGKANQLRGNTPIYVLYGKQDMSVAKHAPALMSALRKAPEGVRNKHAVDKEEALATKLPGSELIGNAALQVNDKIVKYAEEVIAKHRKNVAWKEMRSAMPPLFPLVSFGYQIPN